MESFTDYNTDLDYLIWSKHIITTERGIQFQFVFFLIVYARLLGVKQVETAAYHPFSKWFGSVFESKVLTKQTTKYNLGAILPLALFSSKCREGRLRLYSNLNSFS